MSNRITLNVGATAKALLLVSLLTLGAVWLAGCASEFDPAQANTGPGVFNGSPDDPGLASSVGTICTADEDCSDLDGGECLHLAGDDLPGICTISGCENTLCPVGSSCTDLGPVRGQSVCLADAGDYCSNQCGDGLQCALSIECHDAGCCGSSSCPEVCSMLAVDECVANGLCPADCCQ